MEHKRQGFKSLIILVITVLLSVMVYANMQDIKDWVRLRNYTPSADISRIADDITLTDLAKKVFYVNHPKLQDRAEFTTSCNARGEQTIVLGCYHPIDKGIYVFNVQDERLSGIIEVTSAHEVLHAAYDRLNRSDKERINALLLKYNESLTDERVKSIIATYQRTEPNDVVNEMHSIFATEITDLPTELETHYKQYFADRSKIVALADTYQQEFTSRQTQVKQYDAELVRLKEQITDETSRLSALEQDIATSRNRLEQQRAAGEIEDFNRGVPGFNAQIAQYNRLIGATRSLISTYNDTVNARNAVALQVTELARSIDSDISTIDQ